MWYPKHLRRENDPDINCLRRSYIEIVFNKIHVTGMCGRKIKILWCWWPFPSIAEYFPPDKTEMTMVGPTTREEEMVDLVKDVEFIVVKREPKITKNIIDAGKNLKMIQKVGMTEMGVIDVAAARDAGIPVATLPLSIDRAVAEHALMFMLALSKSLLRAHKTVVDGEYEKLGLSPKETTEYVTFGNWMRLPVLDHVYHKTLGIIGMGEIGSALAERARSFEMKILYCKRTRLSEDEERRLGVQYTKLHDLLRRSDYVSLHVPHTEETEKMIGLRELSMMKPTSYLINVSRGGLIDEKALYGALKSKLIAGAGLDVFEKEPTPRDNPLLKLDNVILTPHIAGSALGPHLPYDLERMSENIFGVAAGRKPLNAITT